MVYSYHIFNKANNKGADQTARMRRLICAFDVRMQKTGFSRDDSELLSVDHLSRLTVVFIISPHELTTIKEIVGVEFLNFDIFDAEPLCNIFHQCLVCSRNVLETRK